MSCNRRKVALSNWQDRSMHQYHTNVADLPTSPGKYNWECYMLTLHLHSYKTKWVGQQYLMQVPQQPHVWILQLPICTLVGPQMWPAPGYLAHLLRNDCWQFWHQGLGLPRIPREESPGVTRLYGRMYIQCAIILMGKGGAYLHSFSSWTELKMYSPLAMAILRTIAIAYVKLSFIFLLDKWTRWKLRVRGRVIQPTEIFKYEYRITNKM